MANIQLGHRIKLARAKHGLSLRQLAAKMDGAVSPQAIGKYERGEMIPGSEVLLALGQALEVSIDYLLAPKNTRLGQVDFRKHSRTSVKEKARVEAEVVGYVERYLQLQSILGGPSRNSRITQTEIATPEQAEELALKLRKSWCLGIDPIVNVVELLEEREQVVLVLDLPDNVSGLTCEVHRDGEPSVPVLVANRGHSLERRRLTLIHELAHRLLVIPGNEKATEKAANRFAGAFLMPEPHLRSTLRIPRRKFEAPEILDLKQVYGVSGAAMWYRIHQLGYTSTSQYEYGCRTFAKTWRSKVEPRELEPSTERGSLEIPRVFERLCFQALAEDLVSLVKAAELLEWDICRVERELRGRA